MLYLRVIKRPLPIVPVAIRIAIIIRKRTRTPTGARLSLVISLTRVPQDSFQWKHVTAERIWKHSKECRETVVCVHRHFATVGKAILRSNEAFRCRVYLTAR
jgi:hypothetical protein